MFDSIPAREISHSYALKLLAASAVGMTIGFGLCGASLVFRKGDSLGVIALGIFALSFVTLLISIVWLVAVVLINTFRK